MATTDMTPKQLAEELGIDPKRLRGWLRKEFSREATVKGTSWAIPTEVADAARDRFAPADEETDEVTETA